MPKDFSIRLSSPLTWCAPKPKSLLSSEQGQIGDGNHRRQSRDRSVDDKKSDLSGLPLQHIAPYTLIFKALSVEHVVFE